MGARRSRNLFFVYCVCRARVAAEGKYDHKSQLGTRFHLFWASRVRLWLDRPSSEVYELVTVNAHASDAALFSSSSYAVCEGDNNKKNKKRKKKKKKEQKELLDVCVLVPCPRDALHEASGDRWSGHSRDLKTASCWETWSLATIPATSIDAIESLYTARHTRKFTTEPGIHLTKLFPCCCCFSLSLSFLLFFRATDLSACRVELWPPYPRLFLYLTLTLLSSSFELGSRRSSTREWYNYRSISRDERDPRKRRE